MSKKMITNSKNIFHFPLYEEVCTFLGLHIFCITDRLAGYIFDHTDKRLYFKNCALSINNLGSSKIAQDKFITKQFFVDIGINTPKSFLFTDRDFKRFYLLLTNHQMNYPLVIKPVNLSQSKGLSVVSSKSELNDALESSFSFSDQLLIEEKIEGLHLSVCVFKDKIYFAYEKKEFSAGEIINDRVPLLNIMYQKICIQAVKSIGLTLATVDCIITPTHFFILEINSAPGFAQYGTLNDTSYKKVKELHIDIFKDFFNIAF